MRPNGAGYDSIPHIAFIKCHLIPFQEPPVFILKRHLLVVLRLVADVGHDRIRFRLADGKCAIARLSMEIINMRDNDCGMVMSVIAALQAAGP